MDIDADLSNFYPQPSPQPPTKLTMNLEICVDSPSCAHLSLQSSANSVELCASLSVGGLTPSISAVASLANIHDKYPQSHVTILVRPREGNFIYTPAEKDLIISDVKTYKDLLSPHGLHSFAVGCLTSDSKLDADFLKTVNDLGEKLRGAKQCFNSVRYGTLCSSHLKSILN